MNKFAYIWKAKPGWAVISGTVKGACALDFGYQTNVEVTEASRVFADAGMSQKKGEGGIDVLGKLDKGPAWIGDAVELLNSYFAGERVKFEIPLDWVGYTGFQKSVWSATARIPYGETRTYAWVAEAAGSPNASRAAGSALGSNPLPVIIPCHRVIRADGGMGGFGMGMNVKEMLLELER